MSSAEVSMPKPRRQVRPLRRPACQPAQAARIRLARGHEARVAAGLPAERSRPNASRAVREGEACRRGDLRLLLDDEELGLLHALGSRGVVGHVDVRGQPPGRAP